MIMKIEVFMKKDEIVHSIMAHVRGMDRQTASSIAASHGGMKKDIHDALEPYSAPLDKDVFMRALKMMEYNKENRRPYLLPYLLYETNTVAAFRIAVMMLNDSLLSGALEWLCDNDKDLPLVGSDTNKGIVLMPSALMAYKLTPLSDTMTMANVKAACKSCNLDGDVVLGMVKQSGWEGFMDTVCAIRNLTYYEYRLTRPRLGAIITKAARTGKVQWLHEFLTHLVIDRPVMTKPIDVEWFDEASQYPFEFYAEASKASEAYTMDDYNALMDARITAFANALTKDTKQHAGGMKATLSNVFLYGRVRNVNSRNIAQWMEAVGGLEPLDERLVKGILPRFPSGRIDAERNLVKISGLNIFSDITLVSDESWTTPRYITFMQGSNATIEYLNAINADGVDSAYRWCVWLRAQRALRENRALVMPANGIRPTTYGNQNLKLLEFRHCPPELIAWLHEGIIPRKLTYDRIGECTMPNDVIKRMQAYPKHFDEWLEREGNQGK